MDVADWLRKLGLEQYSQLFAEHQISADLLPHLTTDDLKDLGISIVGHRRKLLVAAGALGRTVPGEQRTPSSRPRNPVAVDRSLALGPSAERRQISVLLCDIVGSTPLSTQLDPEEMRELLTTFQFDVSTAVTAKGGYVARVIGDALLVYFGWPNADEWHAESAVRAGLAIIDTKLRHNLSIRVGIASGLVVIGDLMSAGSAKQLMAVGETVHLAARLQSLAEPDTILVSDSIRAQVRLLFAMEDLGKVELKGFSDPQHVWRVHGETELSGRSEALFSCTTTPIVGRDQELEFLLCQWRQTISGEGRVVLISGEAGIGKSRLLAALGERLANERYFRLRYFCSPHHQDDALYPIISRWEREVGLARTDTAEDRIRKLETLAASRDIPPDDLPLLAAMLSVPLGDRYPSHDLSPQRRKDKTFDMLIRRVAALAKARPVLWIVEDAHWADPTTIQLIEAGIEHLAGLPVFMVISFRSGFIPPWTGRPASFLALGKLEAHYAEALASQIAGDNVLPASLRDHIIRQSDGVPLFIEEMTRAALEESGNRPGSSTTIVVPRTLQGSLMARLDRLPIAKEVAQIGAVIGRSFSYQLLVAIADRPERMLAQGLRDLVASGLAFLQQGSGPDAVYAFKHALVRDVAYESLPRKRRTELHASVVTVAEADFNATGIKPSRLGHHCAQAGLIAKAARYYRTAGERSAERAGLAETRNHLERGLQFARSLPDGTDQKLLEAESLIALGRLLMAVKGQSDPETRSLFERAVMVCRELGDPEMLARSLFALGAIGMSRGDLPSVQAISEDLLDLARSNQEPRIAIAGHIRLGILEFYQGHLAAARDNLVRAIDLCDEAGHDLPDFAITSSPDVVALAYLANTWAHLGYAERSVEHAEQATERARPLGVASLAYSMALSTSARACQTLGDDVRCRSYVDTLIAVAEEQGFSQYLALGQSILGWLTARQGNIEAGHTTLSAALDVLASLGGQREAVYVNGLMVDVLAWAARPAEAIKLLDETLLTSARLGTMAFDARLRCRKAGILAADPGAGFAAAEQEFKSAIRIAKEHGAKLFELQSCAGLARLWLSQGKCADARVLLEPVYAWFTEGLTLPDLREAREVLVLCSQ